MLSRKNWKNSETSTGVNRYVWVTPGVVNVDENWVKTYKTSGWDEVAVWPIVLTQKAASIGTRALNWSTHNFFACLFRSFIVFFIIPSHVRPLSSQLHRYSHSSLVTSQRLTAFNFRIKSLLSSRHSFCHNPLLAALKHHSNGQISCTTHTWSFGSQPSDVRSLLSTHAFYPLIPSPAKTGSTGTMTTLLSMRPFVSFPSFSLLLEHTTWLFHQSPAALPIKLSTATLAAQTSSSYLEEEASSKAFCKLSFGGTAVHLN